MIESGVYEIKQQEILATGENDGRAMSRGWSRQGVETARKFQELMMVCKESGK